MDFTSTKQLIINTYINLILPLQKNNNVSKKQICKFTKTTSMYLTKLLVAPYYLIQESTKFTLPIELIMFIIQYTQLIHLPLQHMKAGKP